MMMLAVLCSVFVPMLLSVAHERREALRDQIARQHAANVLEVVTLRPWAELQEPLTGIELAPDQRRLFTDLEQSLTVTEIEGSPATKRITVSLTWKHRSGQRTAPLMLHGWVTAPPESKS